MKQLIKKSLKKLELIKKLNTFRLKQINKKFVGLKEYVFNYDGIKILFDTTDSYSHSWFYPRCRNGKIHEPAATNIFIDTIKESDCVLDIGGHIGYFSCISSYLASKGSVHVFEVDPKCIPLIKKNVALNNFANVTVNNNAVSNAIGFEKIPVYDAPSPALRISNNRKQFIEVPSVTVDSYISSKDITPNFIKIDVEGAEWKVLNGMKTTLKQENLKLLVEVHINFLKNNFNTDYRDIIELLLNEGFTIKEIINHRARKTEFNKISSIHDKLSNINTMLYCEK
ncbi:FkbM family methyltransferase [Lacinutrix iliipiscaria]|uniref:FkbM family methyltransferase n=1 Tax=Lacinutrix iliipiscaria TaxID=1230532 RepID=A0ABW5WNN5_9FLAO